MATAMGIARDIAGKVPLAVRRKAILPPDRGSAPARGLPLEQSQTVALSSTEDTREAQPPSPKSASRYSRERLSSRGGRLNSPACRRGCRPAARVRRPQRRTIQPHARPAMLITAIESLVVSLPFTMGGPHTAFAGQRWDRLESCWSASRPTDGLVGWGEAFGHAAIPATTAALDTHRRADGASGATPRDIAALTRRLQHATHLLGRNGAVDLCAFRHRDRAVGHRAASAAGQPLYRLLGGRHARRAAGLCEPAVATAATATWSRNTPRRRSRRAIATSSCTRSRVPTVHAARRAGAGRRDDARHELRLDRRRRRAAWRSRCGR